MDNEDQKKIAAERIRAFRNSLGIGQSAFADLLEMGDSGQSTVSKWERAKQLPGSEYTAKLAQKSGKSSVYFSGLEPFDSSSTNSSRSYPIVGEIQAGAWKEAIEVHHDDMQYATLPDALDVPPYIMKSFVVRGNSMDQIYPDGSIVFVANLFDNPIKPEPGDVVLVQREDVNGLHEASLKELVIDEQGKRWLWPRSSDPEHQAPLAVHNGRETSTDVVILGIVQAAITKPRKRNRR